MSFTALSASIPISAQGAILTELGVALRERQQRIGLALTNFPAVAGQGIPLANENYRFLLRPGIANLLTAPAAGNRYLNPATGEPWADLEELLLAADGSGAWDADLSIGNGNEWRQYQAAFGQLYLTQRTIVSSSNSSADLRYRAGSPQATAEAAWDQARALAGTSGGFATRALRWGVVRTGSSHTATLINEQFTASFNLPAGQLIGFKSQFLAQYAATAPLLAAQHLKWNGVNVKDLRDCASTLTTYQGSVEFDEYVSGTWVCVWSLGSTPEDCPFDFGAAGDRSGGVSLYPLAVAPSQTAHSTSTFDPP